MGPIAPLFFAVMAVLFGAGGIYEYSHRAPVQQIAAPADGRTIEQSVEDTVNRMTPFGAPYRARQIVEKATTPPAKDLSTKDTNE